MQIAILEQLQMHKSNPLAETYTKLHMRAKQWHAEAHISITTALT